MSSKNGSKIVENIVLVSQIGYSMLVPIFIGVFLGNFIDKFFKTSPIFLGVFTIFGIGAAFINLYKIATRGYNRK